MTLLAKIQDLTTRLDTAESAKGAVEEAKALQALADELDQRLERIEALRGDVVLLRTNGVAIEISLTAARQKVQDSMARFEKAAKSTTLRSGQRWRGMLEALDASVTTATVALNSSWAGYTEQRLFGGTSPETIEPRLPKTPINVREIVRYRLAYRSFSAKKRVTPSTQGDFDEIKNLSEELQAIAFQEADDVPESVRRFLDATNLSAGADLTLVTPLVLDWLKANALLDKYMIKARLVGADR